MENVLDRKFSRREWLMIIALCLIIEAWILNIGYSFRTDQDVINYISFASTIASLLLAVIAIIYGFLQSDGQQKSAAAIGSQLMSMRNSQREIDNATSALKGQLTTMERSTDLLGRISDSIEATHAKIGTLEGGVADVKAAIIASNAAKTGQTISNEIAAVTAPNAPSPSTPKSAPSEAHAEPAATTSEGAGGLRSASRSVAKLEQDNELVPLEEIARRFLRASSYQVDLFSYALDRAVRLRESDTLPTWQFISKFVAEPLGASDASRYNKDTWFNLGSEYISILRSLKLASLSTDKDDYTKSTLKISPIVLKLLPVLAQTTRETAETKLATLDIDKVTWTT